MNTPLNPLPDLDTVRREIQVFLRTSPTEPEGVPPVLLSMDMMRRNTDDLFRALEWFGQGQHAPLTTPQGRAAAAVLMRAAFAVQAFNEQLDPYPLEAALHAVRWAETCAQPLVNLVPPPLIDTLGRELPHTNVWLTLTGALGVCTAEQAAEMAAWGILKGLLLACISEMWEDGEREGVLADLLDGLEGRAARP